MQEQIEWYLVESNTVCPKKYTGCFVVIHLIMVVLSVLVSFCDTFTNISQGCFTSTMLGAINVNLGHDSWNILFLFSAHVAMATRETVEKCCSVYSNEMCSGYLRKNYMISVPVTGMYIIQGWCFLELIAWGMHSLLNCAGQWLHSMNFYWHNFIATVALISNYIHRKCCGVITHPCQGCF